ncbi:hypothetical protein ACQQ2N_05005 [Dokdonella sp. MW10]|uniref:hypothetical protein n=1 Tax=Dokdonella sp. MW10 TaxID=2992926 RepID=UPI003F803089
MPDLLVNDLDTATIERLEALASERGLPSNVLARDALRYALGLSDREIVPRAGDDGVMLPGLWHATENQAFREAMEAFKRVESGPSFE